MTDDRGKSLEGSILGMEQKQVIERKSQARTHLAGASVEAKLAALVRMQKMAREMARAAHRPFSGVVWEHAASSDPQ